MSTARITELFLKRYDETSVYTNFKKDLVISIFSGAPALGSQITYGWMETVRIKNDEGKFSRSWVLDDYTAANKKLDVTLEGKFARNPSCDFFLLNTPLGKKEMECLNKVNPIICLALTSDNFEQAAKKSGINIK